MMIYDSISHISLHNIYVKKKKKSASSTMETYYTNNYMWVYMYIRSKHS